MRNYRLSGSDATLHIDLQGQRIMRLTVNINAKAVLDGVAVDILGSTHPFMFVLRADGRPDAVLVLHDLLEEAVRTYLRETPL